ncbi:hypothetical protein ITJ54_03520 [Curtobacterium sp. VKM Ac-2865]|uniref:hypothetical protein n=1 Tax=Curtobacterium sp. VKM Ac-2865 TaxID=2783817 RepID=UPI00188CCDF2|nr:hypothetical protein [Curtobacterium sp. VKM Ac-2865]MBF4581733.1 hypothetical protein [Curtobacterium sp. VKM Ac-2865]
MPTTTVEHRWVGPDTGPFAVWVADRCAAEPQHCVRVATVGRSASGRLVVQTEQLSGMPLPDALDRIGVPTTGVAVTLTLPLLELAVDAAAGAVLLGDARADDVLVDDSGAPVLVDHPPAVDPGSAPARTSESPGTVALFHAVRSVWERVDPREPCRAAVDDAVAGALGGAVEDLRRLVAVVQATGPPRPVRWDPPADVYAVATPAPPAATGILAVVQDVVERGVRLGAGGTRVAPRKVLVGAVVAAGLVAAGVLGLRGT